MTLRKIIEKRIEVLLTTSQATIEPSVHNEIAKEINKLNNYYLKRYGKDYVPRYTNDNTLCWEV